MMIDESWYQKPDNVKEAVSAGGVVIRRDGTQIYVALVKGEAYSQYILPKGHVEPGETLEEAARREIEEEAGFSQLDLMTKLGVRERFNFPKKSWKVTHYFLFSTQQLEGKPTDPNKVYETHWFSLDELPQMIWPEQRELVEFSRQFLAQ